MQKTNTRTTLELFYPRGGSKNIILGKLQDLENGNILPFYSFAITK